VRAAIYVGVLGLCIGGCSADMAMFKADWNWWSRSDQPQSRAQPQVQAYGAEAYVAPDGACAAAAEGQEAAGIALGMSECQLIHLAGPTNMIDIGTNERGERTAVITYAAGERAGIYRFTSGALVSIEGVPPPAQPPPRRRNQRGGPGRS
jgi:hypothetical protein